MIILIPFLVLTALTWIVVAFNTDDSAVSEVQAELEEEVEVEELGMSKHNSANPKSYGQQPAESVFDGTVAGFLAAVHGS